MRLVDADAFIQRLFDYAITDSDREFSDKVKFALESEPTFNDGWIPVTEKLPEEEVLCVDKYGNYIIGWVYMDKISETGYTVENEESSMYNCIAWMPLPSPYTEM